MPAAFEKCIATKGSTKFTKKLPEGKYIHGCRLPGSRKAVWGEIKTAQESAKKKTVKKKTAKKKEWKRKIDKKMRSYGDTDFAKKEIRVNPAKGDTLNTIMHEELHKQYPNKPEKWIRKKADKVEKSATPKTMLKMIRKFAKE